MFQIRLFGNLEIQRHGESLPLPPFNTHSLLALLLLEPELTLRTQIITRLNPDLSAASGRKRLSDLLYTLRRNWKDNPIEADSETICLPAQRRWLDVEAFQEAASRPELEARLRALSLYRGELLPALADEWLLIERESLHLDYVRCAHSVCSTLYRLHDFKRLIPIGEKLLYHEPYDERALVLLMRAYYAVGRRSAALDSYQKFSSLLKEDLHISVQAETRQLAEQIRRGIPADHTAVSGASLSLMPDEILNRARHALERGDWLAVEQSITDIRRKKALLADERVRLLEIDLSLHTESFARAEQLLQEEPSESSPFLLRRAELVFQKREFSAAAELSQRALMLAHELGDSRREAHALIMLAYAQSEGEKGSDPIFHITRAVKIARDLDDVTLLVRSLVVLSRILTLRRQFEAARFHVQEAIYLASSRELRRYHAMAQRVLAWIEFYEGNISAAIQVYQDALGIWEELELDGQQARLLVELVEAYGYVGDSNQQLTLLNRAEKHLKDCHPVQTAILQYNKIFALLACQDANADQAAELACRALTQFESFQQIKWQALTLLALGYALWVGGQNEKSLQALDKSAAAFLRAHDAGSEPEIQIHRTFAFLGLGQIEPALEASREGLIHLASGKILSENTAIYAETAAGCACLAAGDDEKASSHFSKAHQQLLHEAAGIEDSSHRLSIFQRDPITRRLMAEIKTLGAMQDDPQSPQVNAEYTVSDGDGEIRQRDPAPASHSSHQPRFGVSLRRARLKRLLDDARKQDIRLTSADLAIELDVSTRTVERDLAFLRKNS